MTETISALSENDKSYQIKVEKDKDNKWFLTFSILVNSEVKEQKIVTQSRSDNPKTFRLLEDALACALKQCKGLGTTANFKIVLDSEEWELSK